MTQFTRAITRTPSRSLINGITSVNLGQPDYEKALTQHQNYINALKKCGLEVTCLPPLEQYPDSTFVEDVALLTKNCAIITNAGAATRRGEIDHIRPSIENFYSDIEQISAAATIEAGDIMMVGDHFYIGLSERTNADGAHQMIKALIKHGYTGSVINLSEVLHLKTGLGYLENNVLMACGEFLQEPEFKKYQIIEVEQDEAYAANSVWINGKVLTPKGFPNTLAKIQKAGFETLTVDVSEFQKIDGGLSCLSLRF
ncbi:MAG: arginine deiminase family protein [Enterobacterales bacterium]|nr:arginine deiminase family protein [Enterobacterales bacterium]